MTPELLTHAITIFDNYDKWNAFIELSNCKAEIRRRYFEYFKQEIVKYFFENQRNYWDFKAINQEQMRWFLKDYGQDSICIFWYPYSLMLWCEPQKNNVDDVKSLLSTPDFSPIINCFEYKDTLLSATNAHHFCEERNRFSFDDGISYSAIEEENHDKLCWFAGNKTDEMIKQIADKVDKFRTAQITDLLTELNKRCKK
jgi:hypothetical protein